MANSHIKDKTRRFHYAINGFRTRDEVPYNDSFSWWSMKYVYVDRTTGAVFTLEDLQENYNLGFMQKELWNIIELKYTSQEAYVMNVNHPLYTDSNDIVFEE